MKASKILCPHQKNWQDKKRLETSTSGVQLRYCRTVRNEDEGGLAEVVWTCHEERQEYVGRKMMEMKLPGKRKRGRPKRRFLDLVKEDTGEVGAREKDIKNRTLWKNMIRCGYRWLKGKAERRRRSKKLFEDIRWSPSNYLQPKDLSIFRDDNTNVPGTAENTVFISGINSV